MGSMFIGASIRAFIVAAMLGVLFACGGGSSGGQSGGGSGSSTSSWTIGGTVSGLAAGQTVVLLDNGGDALTVSATGAFQFATRVATGAGYLVTVGTQPTGQTCVVSNGANSAIAADISGITVSCTATVLPAGTINVSFDASIPAGTLSAVVQVVSPMDAQNPGTPLQVDATAPEQTVLALDANGDIIAASMESLSSPIVSADTTALAFVRFMIGARPSSISASTLNQAIRASADYSALVSQIASLPADTAPASQASIVQTCLTVVEEAVGNLSTEIGTASTRRAHALALSKPTVTTLLPYSVYQYASLSFDVIKSDVAGNVYVQNQFPIHLSVYPTNADGSQLGSLTASTPQDLDPATLLTNIINKLGFGSSTAVAANANGDYNINVVETQADVGANVLEDTSDAFDLLFSAAGIEDTGPCVSSTIGQVFSGVLAGTQATFMDKWGVAVSYAENPTNIKQIVQIFGTCFIGSATSSSLSNRVASLNTKFSKAFPKLADRLAATIKGLTVTKPLLLAKNALGLATDIWFAIQFDNFSVQAGVCENSGTIYNCDDSIKFVAPPTSMVAGNSTQLSLQAFDVNGNPTLIPSNLVWSTVGGAIAANFHGHSKAQGMKRAVARTRAADAGNGSDTVTQDGVLTAVTPGATTVIATDPETGAQASTVVTVTPAWLPVSVTTTQNVMAIGEPVTISWNSANADSCTTLTGLSALSAASGSQSLTPTSPGTYTFTVACSNSTSYGVGSIDIIVADPSTTLGADAQEKLIYGVGTAAFHSTNFPYAIFGSETCVNGKSISWSDPYVGAIECINNAFGYNGSQFIRGDIGVDDLGNYPPTGIPTGGVQGSARLAPFCPRLSSLSSNSVLPADTIVCYLEGIIPPSTAPQSVSASTSKGQVTLTWVGIDIMNISDSVFTQDYASFFQVFAGSTAGRESPIPLKAAVMGNSLTIDGLGIGLTYYFTIVGFNATGAGPTSQEIAVTVAP